MFLPGRDPCGPNQGLPRVRAVEVVVVASLFSCPMEELPSAWDAAARRGAPPRRPGQRLRRRGGAPPLRPRRVARGGAPFGRLLLRGARSGAPCAHRLPRGPHDGAP
jgi:hypothetical protein